MREFYLDGLFRPKYGGLLFPFDNSRWPYFWRFFVRQFWTYSLADVNWQFHSLTIRKSEYRVKKFTSLIFIQRALGKDSKWPMIQSYGGSAFGMRAKRDVLLIMLTCPFFNSLPYYSLEWLWGKWRICTFCSSLLWRLSGCLVLILVRGFDCETYKTECWFPTQEHLLSMNRESKSNKGHTPRFYKHQK